MSKLIKSSGIFAILTFLSRILGLVRDVIIAKYFTVIETDVFFVALRIPNTFRRFFAEGSFANAFIPVLADYHENQERTSFKKLIDSVFTLLCCALLLVTLLGIIFSYNIVSFSFSDSVEQTKQASKMLKITFPYIFFISITAFFAGILNVHQRFALPAFVPVLLNVSIIIFALVLRHYFDVPSMALAWAVFTGGLAQLLIQIPTLWRLKCLPVLRFNNLSYGVVKILKLMGPTILGSSIGQINILLNTFLATLLIGGSVSWLYYSERLIELPVAMIGVALATVILPKLSIVKDKQDNEFSAVLTWAVKVAFLLGSAAATGLYILSYPLVLVLFQRGEFDLYNVYMTSVSLKIFSISAFSLLMTKVFVSAFYAKQNTKTPVKIGVCCLVINMLISLSLFQKLGHAGLALASTSSALINMGLLLIIIFKNNWINITPSLLSFVAKVFLANLIMAIVISILQHEMLGPRLWGDLSDIYRTYTLFILIVVGVFSYFLILFMLRLKAKELIRYNNDI